MFKMCIMKSARNQELMLQYMQMQFPHCPDDFMDFQTYCLQDVAGVSL